MRSRPAQCRVLCRLDELPAPGSTAATVNLGERQRGILVVRDRSGVFAYYNTCPHTGGPLDWVPGQFLTLDKKFIQCATHGALFRIRDGYCVDGPCLGASLEPVAVSVVDGAVVMAHAVNDGESQ